MCSSDVNMLERRAHATTTRIRLDQGHIERDRFDLNSSASDEGIIAVVWRTSDWSFR